MPRTTTLPFLTERRRNPALTVLHFAWITCPRVSYIRKFSHSPRVEHDKQLSDRCQKSWKFNWNARICLDCKGGIPIFCSICFLRCGLFHLQPTNCSDLRLDSSSWSLRLWTALDITVRIGNRLLVIMDFWFWALLKATNGILVMDYIESKKLIFSFGPYWKQKWTFILGPYWQQKMDF